MQIWSQLQQGTMGTTVAVDSETRYFIADGLAKTAPVDQAVRYLLLRNASRCMR